MNDGQRQAAVRLAFALAFMGLAFSTIYGWGLGPVFLMILSVLFMWVAVSKDKDDE